MTIEMTERQTEIVNAYLEIVSDKTALPTYADLTAKRH